MDAFGREAWEALRAGDCRADAALVEALAAHARAARVDVPEGEAIVDAWAEGIARGQRLRVVGCAMPAGLPASLSGTTVYLSTLLGRMFGRVAVVHEAAHALLATAGFVDSHGDVWRLTLAILMPRELCRGRDPIDLAAAAGVPWWAAVLRADMTTVMVGSESTVSDDRSC